MNQESIPNSADLQKETSFSDVFSGTPATLDDLRTRFPFYDRIFADFKNGYGKVELRKRFMLKMVDEVWVSAVEDTLPALDTIIRNPGVFLQEKEELLPIEQTRKVTNRSVQHLSEHTDLINEIRRDGTVVPSKLLNVFQDDTMLTYENKFINTLLSRLYGFVEMRYDAASECGEDEKNTTLKFEQEFTEGEQKAKIHLSIEVVEHPHEHEVVKNYIYSSDLWKRVEKIHKVVSGYMGSSFVQSMGKSYVRPPVMRTNKILKNVDFRQCLALWEFLETYENTGYETLIQEDLESVSEECIKDFYNSIAAQYVIFQKHIENAFDDENVLDSRLTDTVLHPEIKSELDPFTEREYDRRDLIPDKKPEGGITKTGQEDEIEQAILVALAADSLMTAEEEDPEEEAVLDLDNGGILYRYRYSYLARFIRAQNPTQDYATEVKNELLSYKSVKSRISWNYDTFHVGRNKCARMNIKGKTLYLYLPLPASELDAKYHAIDVHEVKAMEDLPTLLKVRSDRALKYAKELIALVMEKFGVGKLNKFEYVDYHRPFATNEEMASWDPPLVKLLAGGEFGESAPAENTIPEEVPAILPAVESNETAKASGFEFNYRYSFLARLILAQEPTQGFYSELKNELLAYQKVKARTSWNAETFYFGREKCAKLNIKGKTLAVYLPLNPETFVDSKYHVQNVAKAGKECDFPLLLKVRSNRALKYAKELIAMVMAEKGILRLEISEVKDYRLPYETPEQMSYRKPALVKRLHSKDAPLTAEDSVAAFAQEDVMDVAMELAQEDPTEEIAFRYRYSFLARYIQVQEPVQSFYTEIKNFLLSYQKVKSKISWGYEAYRFGKTPIAKIKLKGKSIALYLALDPAPLEGSKYRIKDLTYKNGTLQALPLLFKIHSSRALKHAKELIAMMMERLEIAQDEIPTVDYRLPYQTTEELLALPTPLVKVSASAQSPEFESATEDADLDEEDGNDDEN